MDIITPQQQKFVECYTAGHNITTSAKLAGYSVKNAGIQGSRLLKNVNIQTRIAEFLDGKKLNLEDKKNFCFLTLRRCDEAKSEAIKFNYWSLLADIYGHRRPQSQSTVNIFQDLDARLNKISFPGSVATKNPSPEPRSEAIAHRASIIDQPISVATINSPTESLSSQILDVSSPSVLNSPTETDTDTVIAAAKPTRAAL